MNLVLLFDDDFVDERTVRIGGRRQRHIEDVLRASRGDRIRVGRLGGNLGTGALASAAEGEITIEVELEEPPPPRSPVTLLLAMPRPKVLSRVLTTITVLGVKEIVLFDCWRVEKSFWSSPRLADERIGEALIEGLEQARDTILPRVRIARRFTPFVEDELSSMADGKRCVIAHPGVGSLISPAQVGTIAVIGPEGGFIPNEVEMFERAGFERISLGPRVLHVEAAVPVLLARLTEP